MNLEKKWAAADAAHAKGVQAYIEFGRELAKINATQEQIAARYDIDQSAVARALAVGKDKRIMPNGHNAPKGTRAAYLLTTLDDKGFAELAKPTTTQADILAYKKRIAPPPPVKKKESDPPAVPFEVRMARLREAEAKAAEPELPNLPYVPECPPGPWADIADAYKACDGTRIRKANVLQILGVTRDELVKPALSFYTKECHPDMGGSTEIMAFINQLRKIYHGN